MYVDWPKPPRSMLHAPRGLSAADFYADWVDPWFRMCREALPLSQARVKAYYGFDDAAVFPETMCFWGLPNNGDGT